MASSSVSWVPLVHSFSSFLIVPGRRAYPVCAPLLTGSRSKSSLWFYCDYCRVPASFHVFSDPMDFLLSELSVYLRLFLLLRYTGLFLSTLESFFVYFTDQSFVAWISCCYLFLDLIIFSFKKLCCFWWTEVLSFNIYTPTHQIPLWLVLSFVFFQNSFFTLSH